MATQPRPAPPVATLARADCAMSCVFPHAPPALLRGAVHCAVPPGRRGDRSQDALTLQIEQVVYDKELHASALAGRRGARSQTARSRRSVRPRMPSPPRASRSILLGSRGSPAHRVRRPLYRGGDRRAEHLRGVAAADLVRRSPPQSPPRGRRPLVQRSRGQLAVGPRPQRTHPLGHT